MEHLTFFNLFQMKQQIFAVPGVFVLSVDVGLFINQNYDVSLILTVQELQSTDTAERENIQSLILQWSDTDWILSLLFTCIVSSDDQRVVSSMSHTWLTQSALLCELTLILQLNADADLCQNPAVSHSKRLLERHVGAEFTEGHTVLDLF